MHEETRRRLLRAAFLVLCIVPTATVLGAAAVWNSPLPATWLADQLAQQLAGDVRLARLEHPRRDQLRLLQLELLDPENSSSLLAVPETVATKRGTDWHLRLPELVLDASQLRGLWTIFHDRVVRTELQVSQPVTVATCPLATVRFADRSIPLYDVVWVRGADADMWHKSTLTFRLQPSPADDLADARGAITIQLQRDRQASPLATEVEWDTGEQKLPIALIAAVLGRDYSGPAVFQGSVATGTHEGDYVAEIKGEVSGIDLATLTPKWLPTGSEGTATARLDVLVNRRGLMDGSRGYVVASNATFPHAAIQRLIDAKLFFAGPAYPKIASSDGVLQAVDMKLKVGVGNQNMVCWSGDQGRVVIRSQEGPVLIGSKYSVPISKLADHIATEVDQLSTHVDRIHRMFCL